MKHQTFVISLGGSIVAPDKIDIEFLKKFRRVILDLTKYQNQFIIICGGGSICRYYNLVTKKINPKVSKEDIDRQGIDATKLNARMVRNSFGDIAEKRMLENPHKKISTKKKIIFGHGFEPGHSSDKDAVIAAKTFHARTIINLSNIDNVFTKDPRRYKDAKPLTDCTWSQFRKIVGNTFVPGANYPFDPEASKLAEKLGLRLVVMNGRNIVNLKNFFSGKKFKGTVIKD